MTKARFLCIPFLFIGSHSMAQQLEGDPIFNDPGYYQIASIEVVDSKPLLAVTDVPKGIGSGICTGSKPLSVSPISSLLPAGVSLETIINIGRTLWQIVKANRAQVDIKTDVGTATPQGIGCWTDLHGFANARSEYKTIIIKNFARMKAIEFSYRMIWLPGGSYKGQGKYVGYATMIPSNVYVIGGWKFDAQASMPAVFNQGTSADPIGALTMNMVYRAESHFSVTEQSQSYQMDGDGGFVEL